MAHPDIALHETKSLQNGTGGTLHDGDWEPTYIASASQKKRFRPFFAMQTCPQLTRTTSRAQRMTREQQWLG